MNQIFNIDGKQYRRKQFFCSELAEKILPSLYGTSIKDITYEQLLFMTRVMNEGWKILPGYYGEKTENGTIIKPNTSWFSFVGVNKDEKGDYCIPFQYTMCVNYNKYEITLYDFQGHIGTFPSYADMLHCVDDKFIKMIPCKMTGYNNPFVMGNVESFEGNGCEFDEIFSKDGKVYEGMDFKKLNIHIDYDRLVEMKPEEDAMTDHIHTDEYKKENCHVNVSLNDKMYQLN